jgi:hypothetical protein
MCIYIYILYYIILYFLKYQKFMYPWGATVAFTSGFWGLISEASPATCPGQGAKIGSTLAVTLVYEKANFLILYQNLSRQSWSWLWQPWFWLKNLTNSSVEPPVWLQPRRRRLRNFQPGFPLASVELPRRSGFPIRIPPSEKKNMQNHLHFEPPFPLSCLPFVLIQPQRVINVVAVMECLRDYCCHGMPERFCGTCASAFLLQVFCCSVSSCVFLIRRQSCLVLLLRLLAAGFSETLETQVHTI